VGHLNHHVLAEIDDAPWEGKRGDRLLLVEGELDLRLEEFLDVISAAGVIYVHDHVLIQF
jgi:hypothetical protein